MTAPLIVLAVYIIGVVVAMYVKIKDRISYCKSYGASPKFTNDEIIEAFFVSLTSWMCVLIITIKNKVNRRIK